MRIFKQIEIEGKEVEALFDTGGFYIWVVKEYLESATRVPVRGAFRVAVGGRTIEVREKYSIDGKIEGLGFDTWALPIDKIGKINGHPGDAIIGASTMEQWEIIPNPKDRTLDLSGLKRREFTEFIEI